MDQCLAARRNFLTSLTFFPALLSGHRVQSACSGNVIQIVSNLNNDTFNQVAGACWERKPSAEDIKAAISPFVEKKLPFSWWVVDGDQPASLRTCLESAGLRHSETNVGMTLQLAGVRFDYLDCKSDLTITQAKNATDLTTCGNIMGSLWPDPQPIRQYYEKLGDLAAQGLLCPPQHPVGHTSFQLDPSSKSLIFVARTVSGKPVSTGNVVFSDQSRVAGLYGIVTLEEERGKGYASDMVRHLVNVAKQGGANVVFLHASADGLRVYERLGFVRNGIEANEFALPDDETQ